jgi:dienelactone hydrolase
VLAAALLSYLLPPQQPAAADLSQELARLVDLPTAAERQTAASALAKKNLATTAEWTATCAAFGTFEPKQSGPTRQTVDLQVLGKVEPTEVFLYIPQGYDPSKCAPLLLWGHGAGGSGAREYLLWQTVADKVGLLVLAPTAVSKEPGYAFTPREREAALAALRWARRTVNVDENAIFVGGWSQGGSMTWDLALRHPDLFAGVLPCVGGPRIELGARNNLRYLENVAHLPIRDLQGSEDDPLLLMNLRLAFARLKKLAAPDAVLHEFADRGHDADLGVVDWVAFFGKRRTSEPPRVVRLAADPEETRASWAAITGFEPRVSVEVQPAVNADTWQRLDEAGKRAFLLDRLADYTARLVVQDKDQGHFVADSKLVKSFELLLSSPRVGKDGAVEVRWQNRTIRKKTAPDTTVLLEDFAERFDRTFLPVVRVAIP